MHVRLCLQVYPDQALLLLVTGALGLRILDSALSPALPVLNMFKVISCPCFLMCNILCVDIKSTVSLVLITSCIVLEVDMRM